MLTKCPECELQVSDKAKSCPHCGYPFEQDPKPKYKRSSKRMRLPNGFGQISEIKGRNLRKPFRAMVTTGKDANGRPICKMLKPEAYFETYNDAYAALVEYNRNPYDLSPSITMKELFARWYAEYSQKDLSESTKRATVSLWWHCKPIYDMRVVDVRTRHLKGCMTSESTTPNMQVRIKTLFNQLFDYAVEYELADKNYARTFRVDKDVIKENMSNRKEHLDYTEEEMKLLWDNVDKKNFVDVILIQCYSGWRPQELCLMKISDVDVENWVFTGGMKTEAGVNRQVPIHPRIRDLVLAEYNHAKEIGSEFLFNINNGESHTFRETLSYSRFQKIYTKVKNELGLNPEHRPHDGRVHFITQAKKYNLDEYAIKYLVGHSIADLTERVYTRRDIEWLRSEMEKIK